MNQELSILYERCLEDICLTVAVGWVYQKETDELLDDDTLFSTIQSYEDVLHPLVQKADSETLLVSLRNTHLFEEALLKEIDNLLSYREESRNFSDSVFSPYGVEDRSYLSMELRIRIIETLRVRYILKDIQDGIQEYGFDSFRVDGLDTEENLPLKEIADMSEEEIRKECSTLLQYCIHDDEEEVDNLKNLAALCIAADQYKGGK